MSVHDIATPNLSFGEPGVNSFNAIPRTHDIATPNLSFLEPGETSLLNATPCIQDINP